MHTTDETGPSCIIQALTAAARFSTKHWNRIMLIFVPFGLAASYIGCNDSVVFVLNCLAIIPLADILCQATGDIASFMGETTGALVNVTMGNLTELVIFM
jgi:Ca2+:H+ antiporter